LRGKKYEDLPHNAKIYLKEHPEVMAEVEQKVREKYSKDDTDDKKKEEIPDTDSFSDSIDAGIPAATEEAGE